MKNYFFLLLGILFISFHASAQSPSESFYAQDRISEIKLTIKEKNWMDILDSLRIYAGGMLVVEASIDGQYMGQIGLNYRGSKSYQTGMKRNPFNIKINYFDKEKNYDGLKSIKLSPALRDPSMVREVLAFDIARKYMAAPRANFCNLYINNEYYGVYANIEPIDEKFLARNFQNANNTLIKCAPADEYDIVNPTERCYSKAHAGLVEEKNADCYKNNYEIKSGNGYEELGNLIHILNQDTEHIGDVLDVDKALWMLAFNNVLVNLSSYTGNVSHNYYLYKDNLGRFNPILWDLNLAFGSFKNIDGSSDLNLQQLQTLDPLVHNDNKFKPLISKLLKDDLYKKIYLAHIRTILQENFTNGLYEKKAKEYQKLISSYYNADPNKTYSNDDFNNSLYKTIGQKSKIPGIVELMKSRTDFLKKHKVLTVVPPSIGNVQVLGREKFANELVDKFIIRAKVDKNPKKVRLYYRYNDSDAWQMVYMLDDGNSRDKGANDKLFATTVPSNNNDAIEYYIVAENAAAVSFLPTDYMFKPLKSSLQELNK